MLFAICCFSFVHLIAIPHNSPSITIITTQQCNNTNNGIRRHSNSKINSNILPIDANKYIKSAVLFCFLIWRVSSVASCPLPIHQFFVVCYETPRTLKKNEKALHCNEWNAHWNFAFVFVFFFFLFFSFICAVDDKWSPY